MQFYALINKVLRYIIVPTNGEPAINFRYYLCSALLRIGAFQIITDPCNEVVFETSLNELMEQIRGDQFVDICTGKMDCEWL
jgi:hypothetical protein